MEPGFAVYRVVSLLSVVTVSEFSNSHLYGLHGHFHFVLKHYGGCRVSLGALAQTHHNELARQKLEAKRKADVKTDEWYDVVVIETLSSAASAPCD